MVLAITSMLMLLIFSIGTKATQTGFRLGRRAMSLADVQLGLDTTRALVTSLAVPLPGAKPLPDLDGTASSLTGWATLSQATPCGGPGPVGLLRLSISRQEDGHSTLSCQTGNASANLLDLGASPAAFVFSTDGSTWSDTVHISGQAPVGGAAPAPAANGQPERRLLVRLASVDGRVQLSELLSSGAPGEQGGQAAAPAAAASGTAAQQSGGQAAGAPAGNGG